MPLSILAPLEERLEYDQMSPSLFEEISGTLAEGRYDRHQLEVVEKRCNEMTERAEERFRFLMTANDKLHQQGVAHEKSILALNRAVGLLQRVHAENKDPSLTNLIDTTISNLAIASDELSKL